MDITKLYLTLFAEQLVLEKQDDIFGGTPRPSGKQWEALLASDRRKDQIGLVQRARKVAEANGGLD